MAGKNTNHHTLDDGRSLSKQELQRKKKLDELTEKLTSEGYARTDLTISAAAANVKGPLLSIPFLAVEIAVHRAVYGSIWGVDWTNSSLAWFIVFLILIVVHEIIHGLTWGIFAEHHLRDINFGVIWKMLTPYCTCSSPLSFKTYAIGAAMPTIILGFGLYAVSLINGSVSFYVMALLMTLSGSGDMLILYTLFRQKASGRDVLIYDHPYECGSIVFER